MAYNAAYVGAPSHLWSASGKPALGSHNLDARNSRPTKISSNALSPLPEETKRLQFSSENANNLLPYKWNGYSVVTTKADRRILNPWNDSFENSESISALQRDSMDDVPKTEQNIDTSMGYTGTLSAGESENADLYLSEFSESISQTTDTESHYTIPKILLEPPPSPSKESTRGITAEDLSHVPYRNGYLSTEFLYSDCCIGQHDLMISNDKPSLLPPTDSSVQLPCRYQRRLQEDLENCNVSEDDSKEPDVPHDDMSQREEDLGTALKWIRQEILEMKEQDKSLLKQFIELRASILQLRCLYDPDLQGSCSDVSSVGSGSTYSLNEPGGGMNYSSSISNNINKIHIKSSSNCNVLKSPHQLRRMLLTGGGDFSAVSGRGGSMFGSRGAGGGGAGMVSLSLPNSPRVARLRWRSDEII
ncbi:hypothetical protein RRG08_034821 [Elysia crispata]|uniref:Uncharacterized protein n=1 Tax=Elysia crispata TaxID=231223 RepID=A0AAE1E2C1_9GAST|nr:hypothetical protein RRG08_034821 [Elysia crispata]